MSTRHRVQQAFIVDLVVEGGHYNVITPSGTSISGRFEVLASYVIPWSVIGCRKFCACSRACAWLINRSKQPLKSFLQAKLLGASSNSADFEQSQYIPTTQSECPISGTRCESISRTQAHSKLSCQWTRAAQSPTSQMVPWCEEKNTIAGVIISGRRILHHDLILMMAISGTWHTRIPWMSWSKKMKYWCWNIRNLSHELVRKD